MQKRLFLLFSILFLFIGFLRSQTYSIVIKGRYVIDAKNNIDGIIDIAVNDGKIALVAKNINISQARQVADAKGMYVIPGLIDIHAHVFGGTEPDHYLSNGVVALPPDGFTFRVGVTAVAAVN